MLDKFLHFTQEAAEELKLHGQTLNLTIVGTAGAEIRKRSRQVELTVTNVDGRFLSPLLANVPDQIAGDTPAIPWTELKKKWPHI